MEHSYGHMLYCAEVPAAARSVRGESPAGVPVCFLQGTGGVYFAGAWCGYGFHEDGIKAAVAAVEAMGE